MLLDLGIGAAVAVLLLGYLLYALFWPEEF